MELDEAKYVKMYDFSEDLDSQRENWNFFPLIEN